MKTYEIIVKGKVQGVCYRYFTSQIADKIGITGTVKNLINGDVKAVVNIDPDRMELLLSELRKGSALARVDKIIYNEIPSNQDFPDFRIIY